jgi:heavy metal translocating P-type ATPase
MNSPSASCDLCGLPLRYGSFKLTVAGKTLHFCCLGCKHVYRMLLESSEAGDPSAFKETDLFKKCLEMGIIPESESDLKKRADDNGTEIKSPEKHASGESIALGLSIDGMWCPACAWVIDQTLKESAGIMDASCNFSTDRLRCEYDPILTSPTQIIDHINSLGYKAYLPGESSQAMESRKEFIRFGISAFLTMNVMMLSFALYSGFFSDLSDDAITKISWPMFIMTTFVLYYGGLNIFQKALAGITNAVYSMETLISIGALSAYGYSCYSFYAGSIHQYFDTAAMLVTLVLLGKLIERRAKNRILETLERFFYLMPGKARICTPSYPEGRYVNLGQLKKGDIFQVEEDETVPADGVLLEGEGAIDESSITGEAQPVTKKPGERIRCGTRVKGGTIRVKTEGVGNDSLLGQMIQIMERALGQKAPIEGSTDRILKWFVPIVIILAFSTGIVSMVSGLSQAESMMRSIAVLVIACPCALGIAIPLARVAGVSLAGKKGILVRNFSAFAQANNVSAFVFDKTGTVTEGKWALQEIVVFSDFTKDQILSMAASLERDSDHHIAMELKGQANRKKLDLCEIKDIRYFGNGVSGWMGTHEIKMGSRDFLHREMEPPIFESDKEHSQLDSAVSRVYMSCDGKVCASFVFGDKIRKGAFPAIEELNALEYVVALVSGDGESTTKAVGKKLGVEEAHGGKLPNEKASFIESMQEKGLCVSMVGDGVNDAPALARSDLSLAIYSGSNLAKEAADVTLMRSDPEQILDFLRLAAQVRRKISQNLTFSFLYNVFSIPIAMAGLLTPIIAVCAMLMSSLTVIGNTLLINKKKL